MTRQRRLHGDLGRLEVADFTDHDDVGILTQERSQRVREVQTDLRLDLNLIDSVKLIFDGILDRQDLAFRRIQLQQAGIERRRFAAAGRPGDEQDAVGSMKNVLEPAIEPVP